MCARQVGSSLTHGLCYFKCHSVCISLSKPNRFHPVQEYVQHHQLDRNMVGELLDLSAALLADANPKVSAQMPSCRSQP